ncbi:hypothetical protein ACIPPJ_32820 [Streptomyces sp. NPDC086091]|uniref:hypothetical protein n=1 Tax=Streptomyces sp. NPDC086091 TaxID=3365751 RepID=UPI00381E1FBF
MNDAAEPAGYRAEVRAEGPVYGTGEHTHYVFSTSQSISPVLAIRWLRGEALRIADRLDPDPSHSPWLKRTATAEADAPTTLRTWANDPTTERRARDHIKNGHPLHVTAPDPDCTYTLSVRPVRRDATGPDGTSPEAVPDGTDKLTHPLYAPAARALLPSEGRFHRVGAAAELSFPESNRTPRPKEQP